LAVILGQVLKSDNLPDETGTPYETASGQRVEFGVREDVGGQLFVADYPVGTTEANIVVADKNFANNVMHAVSEVLFAQELVLNA
jgi:hypothetical protein